MKRLAVVLLLLAGITLTACDSGVSPQPDPKPPGTQDFEITGVTPMVARRTQEVTISGTALGTSPGVIIIGGAAAEVISWSDTEVRAVIASGSAHAWQDVVVETAAGNSATAPRFFVGVAFNGDGAALADFADSLDADTAMLLAAGTYELPAAASTLTFKRNHLYGRGAEQTILRTDGAVRWIAGNGQDIAIADLTIEADSFEISNAGTPVVPADPPAESPRRITIRNAHLTIGSSINLRAHELDAGVLLDGVILAGPAADLDVRATHDVLMTASTLTVLETGVHAQGKLALMAGMNISTVNQVWLTAASGVAITDSTIKATAGHISIDAASGAVTLDGNIMTAASGADIVAQNLSSTVATITRNELYVLGDDGPTLKIKLTSGSCVADDNHFKVIDAGRDSEVLFDFDCGITPPTEQIFRKNILTVLGNGSTENPARVRFFGGILDFADNVIATDRGFWLTAWSTADGSVRDNIFTLGAQGLYLYGTGTSILRMEAGNQVSTEGLSGPTNYGLRIGGFKTLAISGKNSFTNSGTPGGTAALLYSQQNGIAEITLKDAVFTGFQRAFYFSHPSAYQGFNVSASGNYFKFPISAQPQVAFLEGITGTDIIELNDNKWDEHTNAATLRNFIGPAPVPASVLLSNVRTTWP